MSDVLVFDEALQLGIYGHEVQILSGPITFTIHTFTQHTMGFLKAKGPYGFIGFVKALNFLKVGLCNLSTSTTNHQDTKLHYQ